MNTQEAIERPKPCPWHMSREELATYPEDASHTCCRPCCDRIVADWRAEHIDKLNTATAHTLAAAGERLGRVVA